MSKTLIPAIPAIVQTLHVSRATAAKMLTRGTVPGVRVGHVWRCREQDILDYIERGGDRPAKATAA